MNKLMTEPLSLERFPLHLGSGAESVMLRAGEYAINPRGVWHTAGVASHATALFITAGMGTEHRPR
jgi:hypothetical protein